jgi:hypothetical protein
MELGYKKKKKKNSFDLIINNNNDKIQNFISYCIY